VANKFDLYEEEQVPKEEGEQLADEIDAIFQETSAKNSTGIEGLFLKIAEKLVPNDLKEFIKKSNTNNEGNIQLKAEPGDAKKKKKCC